MATGQREGKKLIVGDKIDRISELPDDILSCILSNIETKEAVASSVLSKRWEQVWTSVTNLDFCDNFPYTRIPNETEFRMFFEDYVDNVLFRHDGSEIKKCHFHCRPSSHLYSWIYVVVRKRVQNLTIMSTSSVFDVMDLPCSLFDCKTLVVLNINGGFGGFVLNLPSSFSLPNLKTLRLDSVIYVDDDSAERLFSSCPVLEELDIERSIWDGVFILTISVPSLKTLSIFCSEFYDLDYFGEDGHGTKINAPNLQCLTFGDQISQDIFFYPSPSLSKASVFYCQCLYEVLQGLQNVRELILTDKIMESVKDFLGENDIPKFQHLSRLELSVGLNTDWCFLPKLLDSAPNLEVLSFPDGLLIRGDDEDIYCDFIWESPEDIPECLVFHLKTVVINKFVGVESEVDLVKFLLDSSRVLERMMIWNEWGIRGSISRNSEECRVDFF